MWVENKVTGGSVEGLAPGGKITAEEVREQLDRILSAPAFHSSQRCQDLLRFVVEISLQGRAAELKERTLGLEVFGRRASSYDPRADSTVRGKVAEVRKRLRAYYTQAGPQDRVQIEIPAGAYVPEFKVFVSPPRPAAPWHRRACFRLAVLLGVVLLGVAGSALIRSLSGGEPTLRQFWAPAMGSGAPAQLCLSYLPGRPEGDHLMEGGDSAAALQLGVLAHRLGLRYNTRFGDLPFQDLRSSPAVLIGHSCRRWGELSRDLRFVLQVEQPPLAVLDNLTGQRWIPVKEGDTAAGSDFGVITRIFHPGTRVPLVMLAGTDSYGTQAAADVVTCEKALSEALKGAPENWPRSNLQLLVQTRVVSGNPWMPRVLSRHVW